MAAFLMFGTKFLTAIRTNWKWIAGGLLIVAVLSIVAPALSHYRDLVDKAAENERLREVITQQEYSLQAAISTIDGWQERYEILLDYNEALQIINADANALKEQVEDVTDIDLESLEVDELRDLANRAHWFSNCMLERASGDESDDCSHYFATSAQSGAAGPAEPSSP